MIIVSLLLFPYTFYPVTQIMPKAKAKVKAPAKKKAVKRGVAAPKKTAKAGKGAGRPLGSGKYGCKTKAVRVPEHLVAEVQSFVMKKVKSERKS